MNLLATTTHHSATARAGFRAALGTDGTQLALLILRAGGEQGGVLRRQLRTPRGFLSFSYESVGLRSCYHRWHPC
jgi:hypothetical protein